MPILTCRTMDVVSLPCGSTCSSCHSPWSRSSRGAGSVRPRQRPRRTTFRSSAGGSTVHRSVPVVDAQDKNLVRGRLVAIEGTPIDRVLELVRPLTPGDNASNILGLAPHFMLTAEVLAGSGSYRRDRSRAVHARAARRSPCGCRADGDPGEEIHRVVRRRALRPLSVDPAAASRPLDLSGSAKPLWARGLASRRAVYVGYNAVQRPTPAFLRSLGRLVGGPRVRRVIVDVRLNGGGDNTTYGALTDPLGSRQVNHRGRLYRPRRAERRSRQRRTSPPTSTREDGHRSASRPAAASRCTATRSPCRFRPPAGRCTSRPATTSGRRRPEDRRLAVEPDVRVDLTSAEYFAGRDPVLERALKGL